MTKDLTNMTKDELTRYRNTVYEQKPFGPVQWKEVDRVNKHMQEAGL